MDEQQRLSNALTELASAGALVTPKHSTVEAAGFGKVWSGKKADGGLWTLTKNSQESYTVTC